MWTCGLVVCGLVDLSWRRGGTPIYGLYRYVPRDRVWFLRFSVLKLGIFFDPFVTVFLMWSSDRGAKLYYLILECGNARLYECFFLKIDVSF